MRKALSADELDGLGPALAAEGLLSVNRILNLHDGGRAPLASGAEFKKAQDVLAKCLLRGGYTSVEVTRVHSEAGQLLRLAQRREASSARMREEVAGLGSDATGRTSGGGGPADGAGATDSDKGLSKADRDKAKLEELAANVRLQLHGDSIAISVQPVDGDILLAYEALTRTPARLPTYDDLALKTAAEDQSSGTVRYKAGKTFKHKRGASSSAELDLFGRYCEVLRHAGATEAPATFAVTEADERSGVTDGDGNATTMICNYLQMARRQDELVRLVQTQQMSDEVTYRYLWTVREEWSSAFNLHAQTVPAAIATVLGRRLDMAVRAHAPGSPASRKRHAEACGPHGSARAKCSCPAGCEKPLEESWGFRYCLDCWSRNCQHLCSCACTCSDDDAEAKSARPPAPAHASVTNAAARVAGPAATTRMTHRQARRRPRIRRRSRSCLKSMPARKMRRKRRPRSVPLIKTCASTGLRSSAAAVRAAGTPPRTARPATSSFLARRRASRRSTKSSFR